MSRDLRGHISEVAVAALLVLLNGLFAMRVVGLQYGHFSWETFAQAYALPENTFGPDACRDGIDNDSNGLTDCADPSCRGTPPCVRPAPTLSWPALLACTLVLAGAGLWGIRRRRMPRT